MAENYDESLAFSTKIPKKLIFPQIANIILGTLLTFLFSPKKRWFFPQNAPVYRALFRLYCPIIQFVFTPKILKKFIFPQIAPRIQGTLLTFLPKKVIFSQNVPANRALLWLFCPIIQCVFTPKILKKLIFPQIAPRIQGTLLTFLPKKVIFSQNAPAYRELLWHPVCFYT